MNALICIGTFQIAKTMVCKRTEFKFASMVKIIMYLILVCGCDEDGSVGLICEKETGQCPCKDNVTGRQCRVCEEGYKEFPDCVGKYIL